MKKVLSLVLMLTLIGSMCLVFAPGASAAEQVGPDWIITEICMDQKGDGSAGYSDNKDPFEFIEIYNNSGRELNLYDYALTYNGNNRTDERFETVIVESTPIKPGNYLDGSNADYKDGSKGKLTSANMGANPDTCIVAPGEVIVLWVKYYEAYLEIFNDGKGLSMEDFRNFYSIDSSVKVIMVDGNSNTGHGGNDKNFNLKNSGTGTYGIALNSDNIKSANVDGGTYPVNYKDCEELAAWIVVEFGSDTTPFTGSLQNLSITYTVDRESDDMRRMKVLSNFVTPTPGRLSAEGMNALDSVYFAKNQKVVLDGEDFETLEDNEKVTGFKIDGTLYEGEKFEFTAPADGFYKVEAVIEEKSKSDDTPAVDPADTKTDPDDTDSGKTSETPAASGTEEPTSPDTKKNEPETPAATEKPKENGGCKSAVVSSAAMLVIAMAAVFAFKKKH